jgi:hypothetical protein
MQQILYIKVDGSLKGEFALIHDAAEIRYEMYRNCNLTEVGEPFAQQPMAVAVQQGSHLRGEISRVYASILPNTSFKNSYSNMV